MTQMTDDVFCFFFFFFHSFFKFYFWSSLVGWRAKKPKIFFKLLSSDWALRCVYSVNIYQSPTLLQVLTTCACVLSCFQLCYFLCNPMNGSPPGFSILGDSPGKVYWSGVAMPSSRAHNTAIYKTDHMPSEPWVQLCNYLSGSAILLIWSKSIV